MPKTNPLDGFVSPVAVGQVKLPEMPNLGQLVASMGFKEGHEKYHEQMQQWHQQLEQILNERLAPKDAVPPGTIE